MNVISNLSIDPAPEIEFRNEVIRKNSYLAFQEPDKIADALSYIWNEPNKWDIISGNMATSIDSTMLKTKLKNIAKRLNKGQNINWDEERQYKYSIFYNFENCALRQSYVTKDKDIGQIYCLDAIFLNMAKKEIGEENLIKYFKELQ